MPLQDNIRFCCLSISLETKMTFEMLNVTRRKRLSNSGYDEGLKFPDFCKIAIEKSVSFLAEKIFRR